MARQGMDLNNLDKSNWQTYRFDQIAKNISERVDPNNTDLEVYIGLEHIDPESIHIKRTGTPDDVNGQKLRCYPGDVIFGRRRTYQRKAAIVTTDGFCSAHSLVLRANPDVIESKLFPFFLHSDLFMHRAIDISVGSLSPTINWGTLKNQEFLLPPKNQQAQLAELLWAMDEVVENDLKLKSSNSNFFEATRNSVFALNKSGHHLNVLNDDQYLNKTFSQILKIKMLNGIYKPKEFQGKGERMINMGELFAYPVITDEEMSLISLTDKEKEQFLVDEGDLIFARRSLVVEGAGRCSIIGRHHTPMTFESSMIRVRLDSNKVNPKYIYHFLKSDEGKRRIRRIVGFTTVAGIASSDLASIKVPIVSIERQNQITNYLSMFDTLFLTLISKVSNSKALQKSLINQIF